MISHGPDVPTPPDRPCIPVVIPPGPDGLHVLLPALAAALDGSGPAIALLPGSGSPAYREAITAAVRPGQPVPADVAVVAPTSGSTGDPAGVLLPASSLRAAAAAFNDRTGRPQGHRWTAALPLHHAGGLMVAVRALGAGVHPVAVDSLGGAAPFTAAGFAAATAAAQELSRVDARPLAVSLVPPMLAALDAEGAAGWDLLAPYDAVLVGGAATPRALVERLLRRGVRVLASYGMTETCGGAVFDGWPLDGVGVVASPDGRLEICGAQVALGYRDGRHPDRWRHLNGTRCFRTQDLGAVTPDGQVSVHGRADDVVQVGGASVSLGAVEQALRADHRVADALVVAVADPAFGAAPVAFVVLAGPGGGAASDAGPGSAGGPGPGSAAGPGHPPAPEAGVDDLAALVEARLGRAARPRAVLVVPALPLLESGKPDRATLTAVAERRLAARGRA